MNKSETNKMRTRHDQVMKKSYANKEQVTDNTWTNHKQIINKK